MSKSQKIILTGGYWGPKYSRHKPNALSISEDDRDHLFKRLKSRLDQKGVFIVFPFGRSPPLFLEVTPSFWSTCSEFRSPKLGAWMKKRGDAPWHEGVPPKYIAELSTAGAGAIKIKILHKQYTGT